MSIDGLLNLGRVSQAHDRFERGPVPVELLTGRTDRSDDSRLNVVADSGQDGFSCAVKVDGLGLLSPENVDSRPDGGAGVGPWPYIDVRLGVVPRWLPQFAEHDLYDIARLDAFEVDYPVSIDRGHATGANERRVLMDEFGLSPDHETSNQEQPYPGRGIRGCPADGEREDDQQAQTRPYRMVGDGPGDDARSLFWGWLYLGMIIVRQARQLINFLVGGETVRGMDYGGVRESTAGVIPA